MAKEPPATRVAGTGTMLAFGLGDMAGNILYQTFTLLVFTFYYAVVGINVLWMMWGYILWAVWNAVNDPLSGYLSDRTRTRWGRRLPWIWTTLVPLVLVTILLFLPPLGNQWTSFLYFMVVVIAFDALYTIFALNQTSLFPEMFITEESRSRTAQPRAKRLFVSTCQVARKASRASCVWPRWSHSTSNDPLEAFFVQSAHENDIQYRTKNHRKDTPQEH